MDTKITYRRKNNFREHLQDFQNVENIPYYVFEIVEKNLKGKKPTQENIKKILKDNNLSNYYDKIINISYKLSDEEEKEILDEWCDKKVNQMIKDSIEYGYFLDE